eukprot:363299-Chlamydomonas_euryale.AAC.10
MCGKRAGSQLATRRCNSQLCSKPVPLGAFTSAALGGACTSVRRAGASCASAGERGAARPACSWAARTGSPPPPAQQQEQQQRSSSSNSSGSGARTAPRRTYSLCACRAAAAQVLPIRILLARRGGARHGAARRTKLEGSLLTRPRACRGRRPTYCLGRTASTLTRRTLAKQARGTAPARAPRRNSDAERTVRSGRTRACCCCSPPSSLWRRAARKRRTRCLRSRAFRGSGVPPPHAQPSLRGSGQVNENLARCGGRTTRRSGKLRGSWLGGCGGRKFKSVGRCVNVGHESGSRRPNQPARRPSPLRSDASSLYSQRRLSVGLLSLAFSPSLSSPTRDGGEREGSVTGGERRRRRGTAALPRRGGTRRTRAT